jgi:hypothetical protein
LRSLAPCGRLALRSRTTGLGIRHGANYTAKAAQLLKGTDDKT